MEKSKKKVGTKKSTSVARPVAKKKDNNQLKATVLGIAMIVAALGLGVGTYAYYVSNITGTATGSITAWSFLVNDKGTGQSFTADLGDLKPGVEGTIQLNLSAEASGLGVNAVVSFSNATNWPANLKLYSDAQHSSELVIGTDTVTETLAAGQAKTVNIYYEWPIGTTGEAAPSTSQTASVVITVVGTQVNPNA